jgi:hypothetical protein
MVSVTLKQRDFIYFAYRSLTIILLIYNAIWVFPEEKELYESCNWKILCERGKLAVTDRECELYLKQRGLFNPRIHKDEIHGIPYLNVWNETIINNTYVNY